jgi:hypothetical protein
LQSKKEYYLYPWLGLAIGYTFKPFNWKFNTISDRTNLKQILKNTPPKSGIKYWGLICYCSLVMFHIKCYMKSLEQLLDVL